MKRTRTRLAAVALLLALGLIASACSGSGRSLVAPDAAPSPSPLVDSVQATAASIQGYWTQTYPDLYGQPYLALPPGNLYAAGKSGVTVPPCGGAIVTDQDWIGNAFYCYGGNYIAYDARPDGLLTTLQSNFGEPAVGAVFAHEWGHAVQDRANTRRNATILMELQADCFSGAWVAHTIEDSSDGVDITTEDLDAVLNAMLAFRDEPGSSAQAANAHGSGFDRVSAFQDGFEDGASACVPYFEQPPVITEIPFTTRQELRSGGNVAAAKVLPASVEMLNDFYNKAARRVYVPVKMNSVYTYDPADPPESLPTCAGVPLEPEQLTDQVFFCHADRYVVVDGAYLQQVYEEIGDFGVSTLIAGPWAGYVQSLQGVPGVGTEATDEAEDCYTGGFAAALVNGVLVTKTLGPIQASGGDLDEAISAYVSAAELHGASGDTVFVRVDAFRDGFLGGYGSCDAHLPEGSPAT